MCVSATSLHWFGRVWKGKDTNPKTANTAGEKIKIWGFGDILMDRVVAASQRRVGKWPSKREFHRSYGGSRGPCNESSLWWSHGNMTPHRPLWFSLMKMVEGIEDVFSAFCFFIQAGKNVWKILASTPCMDWKSNMIGQRGLEWITRFQVAMCHDGAGDSIRD